MPQLLNMIYRINYPDEVKAEAMIRKSIIINPDHQKTLNKDLISYDNVDSDLNLLNAIT